MKQLPLLVTALTLVLAPSLHAAPGTLAQCQQVKNKIDHYTDKRRHGGSRKQMARWQQQRNDYRSRYGELDCKRHRQSLK